MSLNVFDPNGPAAELSHLSLTSLSAKIEAKEISCRAAVEGYLARIEAYDSHDGLNAFITVTADMALAEADRLDQLLADGTHLGPLHGIPIAIKDNLDTAGIRTTGGCQALDGHIPTADAQVVARLKQAGAIILGKTNMHELAYGITSNNPHYGPVRNPYDLTRIAGGSSGGSAAAVASGLCAGALGTDTGGSIRIPAALCGLVGLKPTVGRVGRGGLMYLSNTMDCIGPMTHTIEDAAFLLNAMTGIDSRDSAASVESAPHYTPDEADWRGIRLGIPCRFFYEDNAPEVAQAMEQALKHMEAAGAEIIEVDLDYDPENLRPASSAIVLSETIHLLADYLQTLETPLTVAEILPHLGQDVAASLGSQVGFKTSSPIPGYAYLDALNKVRPKIQASFEQALADVDALVTPTTPLAAAPIGDDEETLLNERRVGTFGAFIRYTSPSNMTGFPALTVPLQATEEGLPLGLQFLGKPWREAKLLRLGHNWMETNGFKSDAE
ncbi:MAG: amidase [Chloroflexota bacterium]